MKFFLFILVMVGTSISLQSQVGINTTTPQNTLHVAGGVRIDDIPTTSSSYVLVPTSDNDIGKMALPSSSFFETKYLIKKQYITEQSLSTNSYESGNIDLDFSVDIDVPANRIASVDIFFKVPIYVKIDGGHGEILIYTGIRCFKDGSRLRYCDTKENNSVDTRLPYSGQAIFRMVQATGNIVDDIDNSGNSSPITINYELRGFIEKYLSEVTSTVIFGGYSNSNSSYNEGSAYMVVRVIYY